MQGKPPSKNTTDTCRKAAVENPSLSRRASQKVQAFESKAYELKRCSLLNYTRKAYSIVAMAENYHTAFT